MTMKNGSAHEHHTRPDMDVEVNKQLSHQKLDTSSPTVTASAPDDLQVSTHSTSSKKSTSASSLKPASFGSLFQFATSTDLMLFAIGIFFSIIASATMPAINVIFGDVVDAIAEPINVADLVNRSVRAMAILGVYGFGKSCRGDCETQ